MLTDLNLPRDATGSRIKISQTISSSNSGTVCCYTRFLFLLLTVFKAMAMTC